MVEINRFNKLRLIYPQYVLSASSDKFKIFVIYIKVRNMSLVSLKCVYISVYSGIFRCISVRIAVYVGVLRYILVYFCI